MLLYLFERVCITQSRSAGIDYSHDFKGVRKYPYENHVIYIENHLIIETLVTTVRVQ